MISHFIPHLQQTFETLIILFLMGDHFNNLLSQVAAIFTVPFNCSKCSKSSSRVTEAARFGTNQARNPFFVSYLEFNQCSLIQTLHQYIHSPLLDDAADAAIKHSLN